MLESPEMKGKFVETKPRFALDEELEMIHKPSYVKMIAASAGKSHTYLDPDTEASAESYEVAKLAVGGFLNIVDGVVKGDLENGFAFVRPPGHHAEASRAAGFCIFNNVAIGAMHAIRSHGLKRVLIVDWDLHHGNGTQHSFYEDPRVVYVSTHQFPYYPGTGDLREIGRGEGLGYTVNVPLRPGPGDAEYVRIFRRVIQPLAFEYMPELVLLSAGFDIYSRDPLGGMKVTPQGFGMLARVLMDIADECCGGKFAGVLEGGYHLGGLTEGSKAVLDEMCGATRVTEADLRRQEGEADVSINRTIESVIGQIKPYWKCFP
jgi:acetoin utilization deacetylase AcuC-like enzyme